MLWLMQNKSKCGTNTINFYSCNSFRKLDDVQKFVFVTGSEVCTNLSCECLFFFRWKNATLMTEWVNKTSDFLEFISFCGSTFILQSNYILLLKQAYWTCILFLPLVSLCFVLCNQLWEFALEVIWCQTCWTKNPSYAT